jgi:hypothetical protein
MDGSPAKLNMDLGGIWAGVYLNSRLSPWLATARKQAHAHPRHTPSIGQAGKNGQAPKNIRSVGKPKEANPPLGIGSCLDSG